jgi:hypothetical protein
MTRVLASILALTAATTSLGCDKKDGAAQATASASAAATTAPPDPSPSAPPPAPSTVGAAATYAQAPARAVTEKVGEKVWSIHREFYAEGNTRLDVAEVTAVAGTTADVRSLSLIASGPNAWTHESAKDGMTFQRVPGAFVFPARTVEQVKPKAGDIVFAFTQSNVPELVRVKSVQGPIVVFDHADLLGTKLSEYKTDIAEPYGKGLAPFTYAAFKDGGGEKLMIVVSVVGNEVVGIGPGGALSMAKKADCKSLKPEAKVRKVGDKVFAFGAGGDGKQGKIAKVDIDNFAYDVDYTLATWDRIYDKI